MLYISFNMGGICIYLLFSGLQDTNITHVFYDVKEALLEGLRLHLSVRRLRIGENGEVKNSMLIYKSEAPY